MAGTSIANGKPSAPTSRTKTEVIYLQLRGRILDNGIPAHTKLAIPLLEEHFGVSRAPVVDALTWLQRDGYLIHRHPSNFFVIDWTGQDVRETYELRERIEGWAATMFVSNAEAPDLERLSTHHAAISAAVAQTPVDAERFVAAARAFHASIIKLASSRRLDGLNRALTPPAAFRRTVRTLTVRDFQDLDRLYGQLLGAFEDKDSRWVEQLIGAIMRLLMHRHLDHLASSVVPDGADWVGTLDESHQDRGDIRFGAGEPDLEESPLNSLRPGRR